jgi:cell division protein FtsL
MPTAVRAPARAAQRAPRHQPLPATTAPRRDHLRVVQPERARRPRFSPKVGVLITALLFAGLFALAVVHTLLVQGQIRLDQLDEQVAEEQGRYQELRLQVAELESPERIVAVAQTRLGMVSPDDIVYLSPAEPVEDEDEDTVDDVDSGVLAQGEDGWATVKPLLEPAR